MSSTLKDQLRKFNIQGYADPEAKYQANGKGGQILTLKEGEWRYEDEFYGGEPYSGNETIWFNNRPYFRCVYWGFVIEGVKFEEIYSFLRAALSKGPNGSAVHRGPECFVQDSLIYTNTTIGDINNFQCVERIYKSGHEVYTAWFNGGLVDIKKES